MLAYEMASDSPLTCAVRAGETKEKHVVKWQRKIGTLLLTFILISFFQCILNIWFPHVVRNYKKGCGKEE